MDDRVRVYELARRMNLPNADVINTFRELGYDIKSHSSTVDSAAVGLFIAHLGKKKQQQQQAPTKTTTTKTTKATASKAAAAPAAPAVKPRVLNRWRPTPAASEETATEPVAAQIESVPAAPIVEPQPVLENKTIVAEPVEPVTQPAIEKVKQDTPAEEPEVPVAKKEPVAEAAPPELSEPKVEAEPPAAPTKAPVEEPEERNTVRPMTPSVPTRVAAPSFRATPPRAPKAHRSTPSDRHGQKREEKAKPSAATLEVPTILALSTDLTVLELAEKMAVSETEIIKRLFMKGFMRTVNQMVELELARDLAIEMGYELKTLEDIQMEEMVQEEEANRPIELTEDEIAALVPRPPVVTIMGHVDHGKTSLLDAIRQTKFLLTDAEHGGITQHIGAYHVEVPGEDGQARQIVFLDTPGHEAFTAMRARGAKCTDIAILVVAADDGVMPQTIEAIDHAKAAGVPIIVAVNKVDKAGADPDRVLTQLMEHGILPDRFGGETVTVNVSAKKRTGLDDLLEMILLVADMQDLKANPEKAASGTIVEAELHRGKGAVATALVQNGTLRMGDIIVAGSVFGRVRALLDDRGQQVRAAGPSMPVEVLGLPEVPLAGDKFEVCDTLQYAKQLAEQRKIAEQEKRSHRVTLESLHDLVEQGEVKDFNIIVKADVQGTAEAIGDQIRKLSTKEVNVRVLRTASGDISENDVNLAASSNAIVIGFNVQPDANATRAGEAVGVDIRTYNIIYEIVDNLELAIQGLLQPIKQEVHLGTAEVRQVFKLGKHNVIAGCYVNSGKIQRNCFVRISRGNTQIYEGKIDTLRRFKDDVKEVAQGFECGMSFEKFNDLIEGDIINAHIIQEVKRELVR
ncbi:MAG: translation initiation factor IF-2 [Candidatus Obscuribacterales bacterium]|nr:translation initiation factor IF-2 [Candidatus Obscuribacterales bacterium]